MRRTKLLLAVVFVFVLGTGCASYIPTGAIYTGAKGAISAGAGDVTYSKVGTSESTSILGLVATGDASITAAAQNGGIKKIKYVDYEVKNILGMSILDCIQYAHDQSRPPSKINR